eukprot:1160373-Pelagomonas_calceolata.AAC.12
MDQQSKGSGEQGVSGAGYQYSKGGRRARGQESKGSVEQGISIARGQESKGSVEQGVRRVREQQTRSPIKAGKQASALTGRNASEQLQTHCTQLALYMLSRTKPNLRSLQDSYSADIWHCAHKIAHVASKTTFTRMPPKKHTYIHTSTHTSTAQCCAGGASFGVVAAADRAGIS